MKQTNQLEELLRKERDIVACENGIEEVIAEINSYEDKGVTVPSHLRKQLDDEREYLAAVEDRVVRLRKSAVIQWMEGNPMAQKIWRIGEHLRKSNDVTKRIILVDPDSGKVELRSAVKVIDDHWD